MLIMSGFYLLRVAGAREEVPVVMSVQRYVQHVSVVIEDLLQAVPMMDVLHM